MSVRSTPASALRQLHFTATPWTERSATGAVKCSWRNADAGVLRTLIAPPTPQGQ